MHCQEQERYINPKAGQIWHALVSRRRFSIR